MPPAPPPQPPSPLLRRRPARRPSTPPAAVAAGGRYSVRLERASPVRGVWTVDGWADGRECDRASRVDGRADRRRWTDEHDISTSASA
ncbi:hypothetical protein ACI65C_009026 [Semiaphis heraclei]